MSSSLVIACDPGASGAFCVLDSKAIIIDLFDMPSISVKVGKSEQKVLINKAQSLYKDMRLSYHKLN